MVPLILKQFYTVNEIEKVNISLLGALEKRGWISTRVEFNKKVQLDKGIEFRRG